MRGRFRAGDCVWGVGALMIAGLGGCGTDSFAPPPPPELREMLAPTSPQGGGKAASAVSGARPVELILAPRDAEAAGATAHFARTQAGYDGTLVHIVPSVETVTPAGQADLVAAAIKEKPPALIVEAPEKPDPRLATLIDEARGRGIPVVLVGPPLADSAGGDAAKPEAGKRAPLVRVSSVAFQETAKQLVRSAVRVAKNARVDPKGGAILFSGETGDPYMNARVAALKAALTEAGITAQHSVVCPVDNAAAVTALKSALEKEPKATMVFPFDHRSFLAVSTVSGDLDEKRNFVVAGYNSEEKSPFILTINNMAAVSEFRPAKLVRRAVQVAKSLMRGEKVDPTIEVDVSFTDSPPSTGIPELKRPNKKSDLEIGETQPPDKQ